MVGDSERISWGLVRQLVPDVVNSFSDGHVDVVVVNVVFNKVPLQSVSAGMVHVVAIADRFGEGYSIRLCERHHSSFCSSVGLM